MERQELLERRSAARSAVIGEPQVVALTPEQAAEFHGVTVEEWKSDRLGIIAAGLAKRSGIAHGVFYCAARNEHRIWSVSMGEMMGDELVTRYEP